MVGLLGGGLGLDQFMGTGIDQLFKPVTMLFQLQSDKFALCDVTQCAGNEQAMRIRFSSQSIQFDSVE